MFGHITTGRDDLEGSFNRLSFGPRPHGIMGPHEPDPWTYPRIYLWICPWIYPWLYGHNPGHILGYIHGSIHSHAAGVVIAKQPHSRLYSMIWIVANRATCGIGPVEESCP